MVNLVKYTHFLHYENEEYQKGSACYSTGQRWFAQSDELFGTFEDVHLHFKEDISTILNWSLQGTNVSSLITDLSNQMDTQIRLHSRGIYRYEQIMKETSDRSDSDARLVLRSVMAERAYRISEWLGAIRHLQHFVNNEIPRNEPDEVESLALFDL